MKDVYFADTFFWLALANPRDAWHQRVFAWQLAHPRAHYLTTEEVLGEMLDWFSGAGAYLRTIASQTARDILTDPVNIVLPQTSQSFEEALSLYESRPDKSYSLTDCRSMAALRHFGVSEVLTNDHHFTQEGFSILFP